MRTGNSITDVITASNGLTRVGNSIGLANGVNGQILSMSGGVPTWVIPGASTSPVASVFGRYGIITAQAGDYTTDLITEGSNLYYTQARFNTAFGLKSTTDLAEGTNLYFTNTRA